MPTLNIKGQVMYFPGTLPCSNAKVEIYDVDTGGNGDDVIFTGTTDNNGIFQGTSSNWEDKNTVKIAGPLPGSPQITSNVPDVLILQAKVTQGSNSFGRVPVAIAPNGQIPPLILSWGPPPIAKPRVNGKECNDGYDLQAKIRASLEAGISPTTITIYGAEAVLLQPLLVGNFNELKNRVNAKMPGAANMLYTNPVAESTLLAIAVVILCIGAAYTVSIVASAVSVSLLLAFILGYKNIRVKVTTGPGGETGLEFQVNKDAIPLPA